MKLETNQEQQKFTLTLNEEDKFLLIVYEEDDQGNIGARRIINRLNDAEIIGNLVLSQEEMREKMRAQQADKEFNKRFKEAEQVLGGKLVPLPKGGDA